MRFILLTALLLLAACTNAPAPSSNEGYADPFDARDPLKPVNEHIFSFNLKADKWVIKPIATAYHQIPEWGRSGIDNFLTNLEEPATILNGILQLDPKIAFTSFWRFTLNSTFGFAGLRDFAGKDAGLKEQDTDFGKTLGRYGVADGAYIVLPLVGPSTVRDTTGKAVDWFLDPVGWIETWPEAIAQTAADGINTRDQQSAMINQFYYQSLAPYAATRAAYLQHQAFQK